MTGRLKCVFAFLLITAFYPFPVSKKQESIPVIFYPSSLFSRGQGSDQWPLTWGKDGNIYGAWGDGWGWNRKENEPKSFIGITMIQGIPPKVHGIDIWQEDDVNRKPLALISDQNYLYLFYDKKSDGWDGSYLESASVEGKNWHFDDLNRLFSLSEDSMKIIGIAQFGPGYTDLPENLSDQFFYIYLSSRTDGKAPTGKDIWLTRVARNKISQRNAYQFYGGSENGLPNWTNEAKHRTVILHDSAGMGYHISVSYDAPLGKYLLVKSSQINHLGIWMGDQLWGPWHNIYHRQFLNDHWKFTYMIPPKWISGNGHNLWMTFSGWPEEDRINFIQAKLDK